MLLGAFCSDGAGFISISDFDSIIYLLHPCSRANTHRRSRRLLLLAREQAEIKVGCGPASPWDHT